MSRVGYYRATVEVPEGGVGYFDVDGLVGNEASAVRAAREQVNDRYPGGKVLLVSFIDTFTEGSLS